MEPFVVVIYCLGITVQYFLKRYLLIRRYNYPKLLDKKIFEHGVRCIKLLPVFFGTGMLVTIAITYDIVQMWYLFVPSSICVFIGLINLMNPWSVFDEFTKWVTNKIFKKKTRVSKDSTEMHHLTRKPHRTTNRKSQYIEYY